MVTKGETWGGINLEFEIKIYTLLYVKQINNKGLLYSTGDYTQYLMLTYNKKETEKNIYIWLPRWCSGKKSACQCRRCKRCGLWVRSLGQEDPLQQQTAIHSSILALKTPWTEEPGGLQFMLQRVKTRLCVCTCIYIYLNHFTVHLKLTHCRSIIFNKN